MNKESLLKQLNEIADLLQEAKTPKVVFTGKMEQMKKEADTLIKDKIQVAYDKLVNYTINGIKMNGITN